ncbi:uncharacterized protein LOC127705231 isoform X3 [Mytilus californianus]|uniref:uncharacterized protein LOC127705231 isoform X3 n=1 Tax=Mytilus californianus TaxID=6549 RepID=UPI0022467E2C|nr:uncharacterized protein LOC127705231 isoform X3 [Mytilus californianus]
MASWDQKLLTAAREGNIKEVELCVKNKANLECKTDDLWGKTPLMLAAWGGHLEVVTYLATHGSQLDVTDRWGMTPLMLAAWGGHLEVVTYLVTHGSQLEVTDEWRRTPLMLAAERGHLEVVTYLVTHGSQLDATDRDGETALHYAAKYGQIEVTKWLIDQGCSPWVKTKQGETPYDLVTIKSYEDEEEKRKKKEVMDLLKTAMSKISPEVTPDTQLHDSAAPVVEDSIGKGQQSAMLNRLLGKGSYESFDMRCMVTGQFSVGKSTLVKLLAGDVIPDGRHPTDGISLVEGRCGLDIETKSWILIDPEAYNALDVVYNKVLMTSLEEEESEFTKKFDQASDTSPTGYAKATLSSLPSEQSAAAQSLPPQKSSNVPLMVKQMKEKMKTRMTKEEIRRKMEKVLKSGKYKMKVGRLIFWDFGGQYVYLTTHQTFMTFRALFLVVFDGSKDLHEQVPDVMCFPGQHMTPTPAVFLQYWVNSILTYCKVVYPGIPKILFVATHKDKVPKENVETRREELYSGIEELFKDHEGQHHLVFRPLIFVNAKDQADQEIEVLKKTITELTFDHPCWGERMPNACVPLELEIAELVAEGKQIMSLAEVKELNAISEVSVLSPEQLTDFLHFHHSLGKIVYFDTPQLRDNVMINPLLMVEVMRSFITDVAFWPKENKTRKTFKKMSENGMIQKVDLYQIWEQEEFRQILPFKEYIFDMLIHLDIVSEQRRYDTKTGSRLPIENFFVPCMLTQRNDTDFLTQECTPERTVSLAFVFKGTIIPPALPNRLICACLSMWTLKEYHGRKLMFSGFVGLSFDKEHDIVVCVEGNKILLYLVHKRSKGLIIPDIATSVRDCLFVTLERISEFYQSTIHCKANNKLPFHTEYSCSKLNCFTPEENMVVDTEECLCEHGENIKHNWRVWNQKLEQMQCDLSCPGLSEYSLDQIPSNPELLRLSGNCEEDLIHELALRLGMDEIDWRDIGKNNTGNTQMLKFLTLIHLKENNSICFGDLDKSLREMKITTHTLCMVRRRKQVKSRIPDDILDCIPTDEILDKLAPQIGKMVFQLGTELGLSIADLENIDKCSPNLTAQNKEVLFTWRKDRSVKPTIRVIKQALVNIRKGVRCLEEVVKNIDARTLRAVEIVTDRIRDNADRIIRDIQISQILDHMMTHLVISVDDRRRIEQHAGQDDQNKALLEIVIKSREPAYNVFVDGLRNYGYEDIANDLKYYSEEISPSTTLVSAENEGLSDWNVPLYKVRLQKNYLKVITDIQHESIVDHLISREVVSVDDGKKIESGKSPQEKNRTLMDMLLRKNERGFNEFLKALRKDSIYSDLADQIEKTEVTPTDMGILYKCLK